LSIRPFPSTFSSSSISDLSLNQRDTASRLACTETNLSPRHVVAPDSSTFRKLDDLRAHFHEVSGLRWSAHVRPMSVSVRDASHRCFRRPHAQCAQDIPRLRSLVPEGSRSYHPSHSFTCLTALHVIRLARHLQSFLGFVHSSQLKSCTPPHPPRSHSHTP
jgi:hypothetical protein